MQPMEEDGRSVSLPERQRLRQVAQIATVLSLTMALVGLSMVVASFIANGGIINLAPHLYTHFFIALVFSVFALVILKRHPQHTVGWLIMLVGCTASLQFLISGYIALDEDVIIGNPDTALNLAILLDNIVWWPIEVMPFTLILLYFPDGKLLSPLWRIVVIVTVVGLLCGMLVGFHPGPTALGFTVHNPAGIKGSEHVLDALLLVCPVLFSLGGFGSLASVLIRFRRSTGIE